MTLINQKLIKTTYRKVQTTNSVKSVQQCETDLWNKLTLEHGVKE